MQLTASETRDVERMLRDWLTRCRIALTAYNDATTRTVAAERRLGVPAVVFSALVATGVFATLKSQPDLGWRIATGIAAALAAVLTALQTFLRQAERAEQFREAARGYGRMRRRIEQVLLFPPETSEEAKETLKAVAAELDETSQGKPNVPRVLWDRAEYKVKGSCDARGARALRLSLRELLHFGISDGAGLLPEDHELYFDGSESRVVPVSSVRPTQRADEQPKAVARARRQMKRAAKDRAPRRAPLAVREGRDGTYEILDGNATFAVAEQASWATVPVRLEAQSSRLDKKE